MWEIQIEREKNGERNTDKKEKPQVKEKLREGKTHTENGKNSKYAESVGKKDHR